MGIGEEVKFKCIPVNERYYSEDSSYGVYVFHTKNEIPEYDEVPESPFNNIEDARHKRMSTLAGNMQQLYLGSEYEVTAVLDYNNKYKSYQYKPKVITSVAPKTIDQQKKFLQSVVTEKQAEVLIKEYPNIVEEIINGKDDVDLEKLKGIGEKTYKSIKGKVIDNYIISDILVMLQPLGVTYNKIKKLLQDEPNPTLLKEKLINNPYIMLKIKGFGFKTVDQLAIKLNPDIRVSAKRAYAFIDYYLKELGNNQGHTWILISELESAVRDNLNECMDIFKTIIKNEREKEIILHFCDERVGLKNYYESEIAVLKKLKKLNEYTPLNISDNNVESGILKSEKEQGFSFTEEQKEVIRRSVKNNVVIIVGVAGSGKTSISRAILNIYYDANYSISCCALSAMAAQRITEATGFEASTIHRLLGFDSKGF